MTNYSTEQAAKIAQIIGFFLGLTKINIGVGNDELTQIIGASLFLGATVYAWFKRYQKGDINFLGVRKV